MKKNLTKEYFKTKAIEFKALLEICIQEFEQARAIWRSSGYENDGFYHLYCDAEHKMNQAKRDFEHYDILSSEGPIYANRVFYTDWEPWEVIDIKSEKMLVVRKMKTTLLDNAAKALND